MTIEQKKKPGRFARRNIQGRRNFMKGRLHFLRNALKAINQSDTLYFGERVLLRTMQRQLQDLLDLWEPKAPPEGDL